MSRSITLLATFLLSPLAALHAAEISSNDKVSGTLAASAITFVHPGALNSKAELDFVKAKIAAGNQPWKSECERIKSSNYATRGPHGLTSINSESQDAEVSREDATAA